MTKPADTSAQSGPDPERQLDPREDSPPTDYGSSAEEGPTVAAPPCPDALSTPTFPGYDVVRELGRGGMGVVYQAFDRKRQQMVALKTMQGLDPSALLRFKQEFRSLTGLSHPNLVSLYELMGSDGQWFFTMELVEGVHFRDHVAPSSRHQPLSAAQVERLRTALAQLAAGVHFLHQSGKLHRDIKPSNVLVTPSGRVVLLDLGLAAELDHAQQHQSMHVLGTIAYMAPEQAARRPVSPASDWYSVGVLLYLVLTGRLPHEGEGFDVLINKQNVDPPPPSQLVPGAPEDLATLCMELLRRDPEARPKGEEILRRLAPPGAAVEPAPLPRRLEVPLIGRQRHLQTLRDAFEETRRGATVLVDVHGRSGAGKSALLQRFLDDLSERGEAVILKGRCYEQESVPYKALDSLVDALSRYLEQLGAHEVEVLWPRDPTALTRVFPVLRRLGTMWETPRRCLDVSDLREVRRRALAALRELLARLGDRRPLVLAIDDLQWGDEDSADLLIDLLRPPEPPALLLLLYYRSEEVESSACLRTLRTTRALAGLRRLELPVEPLTLPERRELALALLDPRDATLTDRAEAIARQSGGYPFFVYELVQYVQGGASYAGAAGESASDLALSAVLWARIARLPEEARRLLEVVAVASRPLGQADACRAAGIADEHTTLAALRAGRLLRSSGPGENTAIETYHDRIREAVLLHLNSDTLRRHHHRLVTVLEVSEQVDPEMLAIHLVGAGDERRAGHYYALAAAQAAEALAFDRAARLYQLALQLQAPDPEEERRLRTRLADALANAGRGADSARAYLAAANGAGPAVALELQRHAALQLLRSGHIDDGLATLRTVLAGVGMQLLPTPRRTFWALGYQLVRLFVRGIGFRVRSPEQIDPTELARLDVCQTAAIGLSMVDTLQGAYFQTRSLLLALRLGEPEHLVTALTMETAHLAAAGTSKRRKQHYLEVAHDLAQRVNRPYAQAMVVLARGLAAALEGEWRDGQRLCDEAEAILRDSCAGALWERGTAHRFALWPLMLMGEVAEIQRRLPRLLQEARERDDLYEETNLSLVIRTFARLAADEPEQARAEVADVMHRWSHQGFHVQHMNHLYDETQIDLYLGNGEIAWRRLTKEWPTLKRTHILRVQQVRILLLHLRARSALSAASGAKDAERWLREAAGDARALRRESRTWADALALLVEAAVVFGRGEAERSGQLLRAAIDRCTQTDMHLYAAAARRRLGTLLGGEQGSLLRKQADEWMAQQTIRNVERMTGLLVPGWER